MTVKPVETEDSPLFIDDEYIELGCQRTVHDIANAIAFAARHGVATDGCTIYATHSPCTKCAQLVLSAGIVEFYYQEEYRLGDTELLESGGVRVVGHDA